MKYNSCIRINNREISINSPTYFVADLAANHNGDFDMAKKLIYLAKESGADAVKFQHFLADKIVSDYGFKSLGQSFSHQSNWKKSVYETYKDAEFNRNWNASLAEEAKSVGIDFFTSPYDVGALQELKDYVPAYKIGSGDITWLDFIERVAKEGKPVMIATGASNICEVEKAVETIVEYNPNIILMQCNTNYTADTMNYKYINLNVLKTYATLYPGMILGLSDHTFGHATVLGAVAMGARVIEKHFTADNNQIGPDHLFSMNPKTWKDMVERTRELELALGNGIKEVENNEIETRVLQRRCIRAKEVIESGAVITEGMLDYLRPAPVNSIAPYQKDGVIGKRIKCSKKRGEEILFSDLE